MNYMRASVRGRDELTVNVQTVLGLSTKKEAEQIVDAVIEGLEITLLNNLGMNGFTLKLNGFGKFSVRHRPGTVRRVGFSGQTIQTKAVRKIRFVSLGRLRQRERVD
jgi:nucleoid DNA-binding protein